MSMFASAEFTKIRARAEALLPSTCTIQTGTITLDAIGGNTITWGATAESVPCKLSAKSRSQGETGGQFSVYTEWVFHLPYDESVSVGQRIVYESENYDIVSVEDNHDWRVFRGAIARRTE